MHRCLSWQGSICKTELSKFGPSASRAILDTTHSAEQGLVSPFASGEEASLLSSHGARRRGQWDTQALQASSTQQGEQYEPTWE